MMIDDYEINRVEAHKIESGRRKRIVLIFVPGLIGVALGIFAFGYDDAIFWDRSIFNRNLYQVISVIFTFISLLIAISTYLQNGFSSSRGIELEFGLGAMNFKLDNKYETDRLEFEKAAEALRVDIKKALAEIDSARNLVKNMNEGDRKELVDQLRSVISSEANSSIIAELKSQVAETYTRDARNDELVKGFNHSRARLTDELRSLSRRGSLNLSLGAVTTILGLALLGLSVFSELTNTNNLTIFVLHFIPRLTLVIMIEVFAYFFLSLYKSSLQEIKYFQNELTNIESKLVAIQTSIAYGDKVLITDTLSKLAATERNHILSKDQTTVELEKAKLDKESRSEIAKQFAEFFSKKG